LLLLAIAHVADDHGWAQPGIDYLARRVKKTRNAVQKTLAALAVPGPDGPPELEVHYNQGIKTASGATNLYCLPLVRQYQQGVEIITPLESETEKQGVEEITPLDAKIIPLAGEGVEEITPLDAKIIPLDAKIIPNRRRSIEEERHGVEKITPLSDMIDTFAQHFLKLNHAFTSRPIQGAISLALSRYGLEKTIEAYEAAIESAPDNLAAYAAAILRNGGPNRRPAPVAPGNGHYGSKRWRAGACSGAANAPAVSDFSFDHLRGIYVHLESGKEYTESEYDKIVRA